MSRSSSTPVLCSRCGGVEVCWPLVRPGNVGAVLRGRVTCLCHPSNVLTSVVSHLTQSTRDGSQTKREARVNQFVTAPGLHALQSAGVSVGGKR